MCPTSLLPPLLVALALATGARAAAADPAPCVLVLDQPAPVADPETPGVSAQLSPAPTAERRHTFALNGGIASAVGMGGVTYAYNARQWLELEFGLGYGYSGLQFSIMPHFSAGNGTFRFVGGLGLSASVPAGEGAMVKSPALWLNLDVAGLEIRARNGFYFMITGGLGIGLAGGRYSFDGDDEVPSVFGLIFPQGRVAVGWSF